jgi:hypothetical protein
MILMVFKRLIGFSGGCPYTLIDRIGNFCSGDEVAINVESKSLHGTR